MTCWRLTERAIALRLAKLRELREEVGCRRLACRLSNQREAERRAIARQRELADEESELRAMLAGRREAAV